MMQQVSDHHPIIDVLRERARGLNKTVVLPETQDTRIFYATAMALDAGICRVALVGDPERIAQRLAPLAVPVDAVRIIDPTDEHTLQRCAQVYAATRHGQDLSPEQAREIVADPLYCAACLLKRGEVDASVAGATHSTADVLRALLRVIGCSPQVKTISSCLVMTVPSRRVGEDGVLLFADCGVVPQPSAEQLADIAISAAYSARLYLQAEPRVAMLSFSTKGSARHEDVEKVTRATQIARSKTSALVLRARARS